MHTDFYTWVDAHHAEDPAKLRLKYGRERADEITQIECRRKYGKKLAQTLAAAPTFYFPSLLAGEQSTSDRLAAWHATLGTEGSSAIDLTAGLGIDALHMARRASSVVAVEMDADKAEALRHNAAALGVENIEVICGDCRRVVADMLSTGRHFATAFIDPARRADDGARVFALADCNPDVVAMLPQLARLCDRLIIKASPMLDITHTALALGGNATAVIATGSATECKELVAIVDFAPKDSTETQPGTTPYTIEAVTLLPDGSVNTFAFTPEQERNTPLPPMVKNIAAGMYVYEPWPTVMKTGATRIPAARYGLQIFHANTRLFTSSEPIDLFPGRRYEIVEALPYASSVIKRFSRRYSQINVAVRNFGMSADALRAKLGVRNGGTFKLFGITDSADRRWLLVVKEARSD